jgi:transglutaminase-like putative cysteine protease
MTPKISVKTPKLNGTLYALFTVFALIFVIIERTIYSLRFHHYDIDFDELFGPYIGMVVGTFIIAQLCSYLLEKQKYKLGVVIAGLILSGLIIVYVPFIRDFLLWIFGFVSGSSYNNFLLGLIQGIMVGAVIGFILYVVLFFLKSPLPLLLFYVAAISDSLAEKRAEEITYYIILFFVIFLVLTAFFFFQHKISLKKTAKSSLVILIALIVAGLGISYQIAAVINDEQLRKLETIQLIREKQREEQQAKQPEQVTIPIDQPVGGSTIDIVGFYQAPTPLYLKFELFKIEQQSDQLQITPIKAYSIPSTYKASLSEDGKEAKIVFAHFSGQNLLTAERITSFDTTKYRLADGVLVSKVYSSALERVSSYEFTYRTYATGDVHYPDQYSQADYTTVSILSEQYDEIAILAREITKGLTTDFEKARAIQQYFHKNFTYTLNPGFNDKVNPIDDFLFETKKGYCVQYAVATSIMLDIIDVRSRMVGGYFSDEYVPELESYVIVSKQAHVWNEVFLSEYGWVTIDSTPFAPIAGTEITGGVPLTAEEKQQIKASLKAVAPTISFDDIYDSNGEAVPPIEPGKVLQETDREKLEREAKESLEREKKLEEERKLAEEAKKKREEQNSKVRGIILFVVVVIGGGSTVIYLIYRRIKYRRELEIEAFIVKMTKIDHAIRKKILKKYSLENSLVKESSKRFLKQLPITASELSDLVAFYAIWNKVRFANEYSGTDMQKLLELSKQLQVLQ